MSCIKIDKPLVVYRFLGNVLMSIKNVAVHNDKINTFLRKKRYFKVIFMSIDK